MSTTTPGAPAIELEHVSQVFGSFAALRDVSLTVSPGSSVVLLGENGAGKSTLLRLLAGLATPTYGSLRVLGAHPRQRLGRIAYAGHASMLYDELTGPENLRYFARLRERSIRSSTISEQAKQALAAVGLDPNNPRRVGEYSQGMRQRASLARVLMGDPDLLLLDEPFSNLDGASAQAIIVRLQDFLARPGTGGSARTLVLTTHQVELARSLAQITIVLRAGRILEQGPTTKLVRSNQGSYPPVAMVTAP